MATRHLASLSSKGNKVPPPQRRLDRHGLAFCIGEVSQGWLRGLGFLQLLMSPCLHQPTGHPNQRDAELGLFFRFVLFCFAYMWNVCRFAHFETHMCTRTCAWECTWRVEAGAIVFLAALIYRSISSSAARTLGL